MGSCASLDQDECRQADWYGVGLEDGARGRPVERLGDHRRACAKHNVTPDAARYVAGRNDGLKSFCGRELHDLNRRLDEINKDIARTKANEVERLEALTREAEQLELRIQEAERR